MTEYVSIPTELLTELREGLAKIEEILATLEELSDKDGLKEIREAEKEYEKGDFSITRNAEEIRKLVE
ncbi:hypothetical protein H8E65_03375 [Candidatus Bathyarchaeota archaeon]|nr:hypothetical protein [Candidatus Bathyarchaeota archaeon]MBL7080651.1 hypothetical protein [Candidatus Bathyarchaeota archaeon]